MNKEQKYLVTLCGDYLSKKSEIVLDESIDYSMLFSVAKNHNLAAIAFCVLKNGKNKEIIPREIYRKFEDSFYEAIFRYDKQGAVIEELEKILSENNIKFTFFKGSLLRDYFPVPQARVMGDIDILIPSDKRDEVKRLLLSNGFEIENSNGPVYDYVKGGVLVEVHTKIVSGKVGNSDAEGYFSDAIEHITDDGQLDATYHFAYLLTHLAHHFWFYGAGIKLIVDLAVMLTSFEVDIDRVMDIMREISLEEFAENALSVCCKWFGVGQDFEKDTAKTEQFLISFGAFGNLNRNKAAVVERKELEEGKKSSAFKTKFRLLFPSYDKIKYIPYIRFIEGRPYLLPLAWAYRIVYNLTKRRKFVADVTHAIGSDETKKQAQKELEYFEEIGLL